MDTEIYGYCDRKFAAVKKAFAANFAENLEIGASYAVTINGETVVDLWAGYEDPKKRRPWQENTLVCVFSSTKVPTALCIHMLADQGKIDLDAPVADYWPEFHQNGKSRILVRHLLSHTAGLPGFEGRVTKGFLYDWIRTVNRLAAQKPLWEPGTRSGYHSITYGYLLGEVLRRVTGKTIGTFFQENIAAPLHIDFYYGLPPEHRHRVAELYFHREYPFSSVPYPLVQLAEKAVSHTPHVFLNPIVRTADTRTAAFYDAEIPGSNGHGNGRSLARIGAVIACEGTLEGKTLLSPAALRKATSTQIYGYDVVLRVPLRWGLGFALTQQPAKHGSSRGLFWGGYGGSNLYVDLDKKISMGYAMNNGVLNFIGDRRSMRLATAVYEALN